MNRGPKTYQVVLLEEDENKCKSYRYSDLFPDEKEEDIKIKLTNEFQSKFPLISRFF